MTTARAAGPPQLPAPAGAILVVDDDDAVRGVIALGLRRAGFEVIEVSGGEAALEAVQTESVCLVVLDIGMPGISGIEVVETSDEANVLRRLGIEYAQGHLFGRPAVVH